MKGLKHFFEKFKNNYTDDNLINMAEKLRNRILILHMETPYNKILIQDLLGIKIINGFKYIELRGYNLNRQAVRILVSLKMYVKLYKSVDEIYKPTDTDEIYLKDIENLDCNK